MRITEKLANEIRIMVRIHKCSQNDKNPPELFDLFHQPLSEEK